MLVVGIAAVAAPQARVDSHDSSISAPPTAFDSMAELAVSLGDISDDTPSAPSTMVSPFPSTGLDASLDASSDEEDGQAPPSLPGDDETADDSTDPRLGSLARISDLLRRSLPRNPIINEPKIFSEMLYRVRRPPVVGAHGLSVCLFGTLTYTVFVVVPCG